MTNHMITVRRTCDIPQEYTTYSPSKEFPLAIVEFVGDCMIKVCAYTTSVTKARELADSYALTYGAVH